MKPRAALVSMSRLPLSPGVRHMVAAAFYFSLMSVLVKMAGERLHTFQIVLARGVVCSVLSLVWIHRAGIRPMFGTHRAALVLRGVFGTLGLICIYYSVVTLPLAEAVVIQYTHPIMTALLAIPLLSERPDRRLLVAIALCSIGVVVITRPETLFGDGSADLAPLGLAAGFAGALAAAIAYTLVRRLRDREAPLVIVLYFPLVTVPMALPLAATQWLWPTATEWLLLLGVGVTTQVAQVHLTHGLTLEKAGKATSIGYIQVALAALWGSIFFNEIPDTWTIGGGILILAALWFLAVGRQGKLPR